MFPPAGSRFSFFFFYLFFCRHNTQHTTLPAFDHNSIICILYVQHEQYVLSRFNVKRDTKYEIRNTCTRYVILYIRANSFQRETSEIRDTLHTCYRDTIYYTVIMASSSRSSSSSASHANITYAIAEGVRAGEISEVLLLDEFPTKESFQSNYKLIKEGVIEGYNATEFYRRTEKLVGKRNLTGNDKVDQQQRVQKESMIFNYIHRLKNRLYDSGGKKRKDRNNDDLQSQGLKLEQSYLKAEAECSKKKERYEKYCTKNPTYKRTPQKKYKESSDQEDDESEEYSDREGEECSDEEGEEGDCSVTDNEEDNSGVDDEEDDEDYNEENNEVDISDIADYHTKNLTENFKEGDTNQQKIDKINKKFKVSSLRLHPDKHPSATETKKAELTNSFQVMSNVRTSLIAQLKYKL